MNFYSNNDCSYLLDKRIVLIGYGSQGRAQALNLRDSGVINLKISLDSSSHSIKTAEEDGFQVIETQRASEDSDIIVMLAPDELHKEIYQKYLQDRLKKGQTLLFAHGFSIHYKLVQPEPEIDICMVSPKAVGPAVRNQYLKNQAIACFIAIENNLSGHAQLVAESYAAAISPNNILIYTTFCEETESNLFSEQVVLCGGIPTLIQAAFETLIEAGFSPEVSYWGCLHEVKLITDLIHTGGLSNMYEMISNTAEYGAYLTGRKIIDQHVKSRMKDALKNIKDNHFLNIFLAEYKSNFATLIKNRIEIKKHAIELVGNHFRAAIANDNKKSFD